MMFNKAISILPFVAVVMSQTVDVSFYNGTGCSSVGVTCVGLTPGSCCCEVGSPASWQSISTDNWSGVSPNTFVHAMAGISEDSEECTIDVGTLTSGSCFDSGSPTGITSSRFFNGEGEALKERDDTSGCQRHPIDIYFYSPGDGFQYIVNATNPAHSAAINSAKSSQDAEQYIVTNFDKKVSILA
ncbi:hypothetical protein EW026_g8007 [Hermanssonia centrifuga]|uniref:Uncharacterized protein n=1 Tax=Hermanssonia centrifuga TaxID=98765 RepID=A0A4S4K5W7_9APHY|nr:hypothetical protein EW026_g8007 [Hermanssonia centrifuga]